jgi:hypothetical protein
MSDVKIPSTTRPNHRAGHATETARERHSADYCRGDRVEFEAASDRGLAADGARHVPQRRCCAA